jgi:hypothetical protein
MRDTQDDGDVRGLWSRYDFAGIPPLRSPRGEAPRRKKWAASVGTTVEKGRTGAAPLQCRDSRDDAVIVPMMMPLWIRETANNRNVSRNG